MEKNLIFFKRLLIVFFLRINEVWIWIFGKIFHCFSFNLNNHNSVKPQLHTQLVTQWFHKTNITLWITYLRNAIALDSHSLSLLLDLSFQFLTHIIYWSIVNKECINRYLEIKYLMHLIHRCTSVISLW